MSIDVETARRVAKLARIRVEEADLPRLPESSTRSWASSSS
jgi:hypothetical protein